MNCPTCHAPIPDAAIQSEIGRRQNARRKTHVGPPKVLRPCPHCRARFGARELRAHKPQCPEKPSPGGRRLNYRQELYHEALMLMKMSAWPPALQEHMQQHEKEAVCGDAIACWVADWVRAADGAVSRRRSEDNDPAGPGGKERDDD